MARWGIRAALALGVATAGVAGPAGGEIYRWTDADGRVHFTQDLSRVPASQRPAARDAAATAAASPSRVQGFEAPAAPAARRPLAPRMGSAAGRVHRIEVPRAANGMIVPVRINGTTVAPFLIDTGASYVLLPRRVAEEAGVAIGPDTRTMRFTTANGIVEQAVVTLDSVELGTARAEQVAASVSDQMQVGLLGLSFFNRFTYQIDAAAGLVTLAENDLAETGQILGGRSEEQWRGEFASLRGRIAEIEWMRAQTPASRSRRFDRLDEEQRVAERQLDALDAEADQANVPQGWRQ